MASAYLDKLRKVKDESYANGLWDGMRMGFNLVAIALNHNKKFGFGEKRLKELEADVQDLVDELIDNDPIVNKVHIENAIKQIRGEAYGT